MPQSGKLSAHLLETFKASYARAVEAPFLARCGDGTVSRSALTLWLRQDLCYASLGYPRAMGHFIAKLDPSPISVTVFESLSADFPPRATLQTRILNIVAESLLLITKEVAFFVETLKKYDLVSDPGGLASEEGHGGLVKLMEPTTQAYLDFMLATTSSRSVEESMVLLWAMERCYLDAWSFSKRRLETRKPSSKPSNVEAATTELINNWTSEPFAEFVQQLEDIVDDLEVPVDPKNETYCKVEATFRHMIWLEERFWPVVE